MCATVNVLCVVFIGTVGDVYTAVPVVCETMGEPDLHAAGRGRSVISVGRNQINGSKYTELLLILQLFC